MSNQANQASENQIIKEKLKKVEELKEVGIEPYGRKYGKIDDLMIMKPFPQYVEDKKLRDDIWHK